MREFSFEIELADGTKTTFGTLATNAAEAQRKADEFEKRMRGRAPDGSLTRYGYKGGKPREAVS